MISKLATALSNILKFHKRKLFAMGIFYLLFLYWLFPFNDLGDLVAAQVSEKTGGQIFVNFDTLNLSLIPQPGLALSNVFVDTPYTPRLTAKSLSLAPSITGLLTFKPGVNVHAEELLGGDIELSTRGSGRNPAGKVKQKLNLELTGLSIDEIAKLIKLPVKISGSLSGNLESLIDTDFTEQPSGTLELRAEKVVMPEGNVGTPMGPLPLPKLTLNDVVLSSKADKGALDITTLTVGRPGGDLYASVTGRVDLRVEKAGTEIYPRFNGYNLIVQLQMNDALKSKVGAFLAGYQSGNGYAFRLTSNPPYISRIQ